MAAIKILSLTFVILMFSGCTGMISIGEETTFCAENGKDFSDAGWCDDPYRVYENADAISEINENLNKGKKCLK